MLPCREGARATAQAKTSLTVSRYNYLVSFVWVIRALAAYYGQRFHLLGLACVIQDLFSNVVVASVRLCWRSHRIGVI